MGAYADSMAEFRCQVTSPDQNIVALLAGQKNLQLQFRSDAYYSYSEAELQQQLQELLKECWRTWQVARRQALSDAVGYQVETRVPRSPQERKFREAKDDIVGIGFADGIEVVYIDEGENWEVNFEDGVLVQLEEAEFLASFKPALTSAVQDYQSEVAKAKARIYELRHDKLVKMTSKWYTAKQANQR